MTTSPQTAAQALAERVPDELFNAERRELHDLGFRLLFNLAEEYDPMTSDVQYVATVRLLPESPRARAMFAGQAGEGKDAEYLEVEQRFDPDLSLAPFAVGDAIREGIEVIRQVG